MRDGGGGWQTDKTLRESRKGEVGDKGVHGTVQRHTAQHPTDTAIKLMFFGFF